MAYDRYVTFIRSSRLSISNANKGKHTLYDTFIDEYRRVFTIVLDDMWEWDKMSRFGSYASKRFKHVDTWLAAAIMQCVAGQASALIRGTRKSAKALGVVPSKPTNVAVCPELDERFGRIEWTSTTSFDGWLTFKKFGKRGSRLKIVIPLKRTKHLNALVAKGGIQTKGFHLSKKGVTLVFKTPRKTVTGTKSLGVDVGIIDIIHTSDDQILGQNHPHGHTLSKIQQRLSRHKKGSKGFKRAQDLRDNFIGWSVNQLNLDDVNELKVEDLKGMKQGKKNPRFLSHWSYATIFRRLEMKAEEHGVRVTKVDPRNTSRTCPICGAVDKRNRRGKVFRCVTCGHAADADLVGAINIQCAPPKVVVQRGAYSPSCKQNVIET